MNMMLRMAAPSDGFVFCPEPGYPRLIRFDLPDNDLGLVCELEPEFNLLHVNQCLFNTCSETEKHVILKSRGSLYMIDLGHFRE